MFLRAFNQSHGFVIAPGPYFEQEQLAAVEHERHIAEHAGDTPVTKAGFRQPHQPKSWLEPDVARYLPSVKPLLREPGFIDALVEILDAKRIQLWGISLSVRRPNDQIRIGWHQDFALWSEDWHSPQGLALAVIPMTRLTPDSAPPRFVPGSHRWGFTGTGDFFAQDNEAQIEYMRTQYGDRWQEVDALVQPGGLLVYSSLTYHGCQMNTSGSDRSLLALLLSTEKSQLKSTSDLVAGLDDTGRYPLLVG
ncbi:MAG: phytanoyl-CoA dioxygenase family protein [Fimbriimonas sp.]